MTWKEATIELPAEIEQFLSHALKEQGFELTEPIDPIAVIAVVLARLTEVIDKRRRRRLILWAITIGFFTSLTASLLGIYIGQSHVWETLNKARPVINFSGSGGAIIYGTVSGKDVVRITSSRPIEQARVENGEAILVFK